MTLSSKLCIHCNTPFSPKKSTSKYCTQACFQEKTCESRKIVKKTKQCKSCKEMFLTARNDVINCEKCRRKHKMNYIERFLTQKEIKKPKIDCLKFTGYGNS